MGLSDIVSRLAEMVGATAIWLSRSQGSARSRLSARARRSRRQDPRAAVPTLKMPTAKGWSQGLTPVAAPGLKVNAFASGLKHPRWIHVLPSGEVLVAEALMESVPIKSFFDYAMFSTLKRAAAVGPSPNRITLLGDKDGDGVAEIRNVFLDGLNQPFGMALVGDTFYVGNTDGVVAFPYTAGASRITAPGRKLIAFKTDGHWTRSLLASPDGTKLYAGVGSLTNIADDGMAVEEGRAAIYELDLKSGGEPHLRERPAQSGRPRLGASDRRAVDVGQRARRARRRDAARLSDLGSRRRLLRLALLLLGADGGRPRAPGCGHGREGDHARLCARRPHRVARPLLAAGRRASRVSRGHGDRPARLVEPQHARRLQGRVRAVRGRAPGRTAARYPDGFLSPDERSSYGRPVGVALGPDGSLLVADDVGDVIWRVTGRDGSERLRRASLRKGRRVREWREGGRCG